MTEHPYRPNGYGDCAHCSGPPTAVAHTRAAQRAAETAEFNAGMAELETLAELVTTRIKELAKVGAPNTLALNYLLHLRNWETCDGWVTVTSDPFPDPARELLEAWRTELEGANA